MSTVDADPEVDAREEHLAQARTADLELTAAREAHLGDLAVRRLLPLRHRRSIGGWCFVDHYGPTSVDGGPGMQVPPHPHIGLQTVTWLFEGEVAHRDTLGSEQVIRPGQLNLMTAGRGIAHSEQSVSDDGPCLHGLQLWIALPDTARRTAPHFEHHAELPITEVGSLRVTVLAGVLDGVRSPAKTYSDLVGADIEARHEVTSELPLLAAHEHGVVAACGHALVSGNVLRPGQLLYLPRGREALPLSATAGTRLFLFGGEPSEERLLMWWNFVGRTPEDIAQAVADWNQGRFGTVPGNLSPLRAPTLDAARLVARQ